MAATQDAWASSALRDVSVEQRFLGADGIAVARVLELVAAIALQ